MTQMTNTEVLTIFRSQVPTKPFRVLLPNGTEHIFLEVIRANEIDKTIDLPNPAGASELEITSVTCQILNLLLDKNCLINIVIKRKVPGGSAVLRI